MIHSCHNVAARSVDIRFFFLVIFFCPKNIKLANQSINHRSNNLCTTHERELQVDEVIDAVQDAELRDKLRTVCLTDERCYMTFANGECLERALHTAFKIRDVPVLLMDTGSGATILSLAGVPDAVTDKDVLKSLKKYGTIIGMRKKKRKKKPFRFAHARARVCRGGIIFVKRTSAAAVDHKN